jgi:hypothetical protein
VGAAHVQNAHVDLVVRLNRQSLPLFDLTDGAHYGRATQKARFP